MTENNAAQPGLTDDEIEALAKKHIAPHADRLDKLLPHRVPYQQTEQFRRVKALIGDLLSKLRAEGVQAGDERAALQRIVDTAKDGANSGDRHARCVEIARAALASAPVAGERHGDSHIGDAAPQASEAVRNALAELVRLQDAKDSQNHFPNPQRSKEWAEYRRLWPAAMEAARAALSAQSSGNSGELAAQKPSRTDGGGHG